MKRFSLSLLILVSLFSRHTLAEERELPLVVCPSNPQALIPIHQLDRKRLFSSIDDPPITIKLPKGVRNVRVEEKPLPSRISQDMLTVAQLGLSWLDQNIMLMNTPKSLILPAPECVQYKQPYLRTTVSMTTVQENNQSQTYHFFVGEEDHFYLSADMPITSINELYYDERTNSLIEKEQPASFYFGLNYKIGDLSTSYPLREFYNNFALKAIAKFAKKPSESMGIGVGYHLNQNIELFIARVWTQDNNNVGKAHLGYTVTNTFGVSFNLTKALLWFRK